MRYDTIENYGSPENLLNYKLVERVKQLVMKWNYYNKYSLINFNYYELNYLVNYRITL